MRLREDSRQLDGRVEIDDAYLGGQRSGRQARTRLAEQGALHRRVQTTAEGKPVQACFSQQPFTSEAVAIFAAKSLGARGQVVSDGLWCFRA